MGGAKDIGGGAIGLRVLHFYSFRCHSRKRSRRSDSCNTLHRFSSFGCHASSQSIEKTSVTFQGISNIGAKNTNSFSK
ncbi:unnamed protein product [Lactuca virosa]|uniref:Uncharacterized protein n=1 Tax=Lactuca virosa TaxID=75947 RepID=A0AAU9NHW0_9ASTR|nr:unnamed protein product [Lactuca virosa]